MKYAGILAGGIGSRMESAVPKQFLKIAGVPIVIRTIRAFLNAEGLDKVVLAMNPQWREYFDNMAAEYNVDMSRVIVINGGTSRFRSMVNIVKACIEDRPVADKKDVLVVHDCARPFLSERIIKDNINFDDKFSMVTTAVPTIDTVLVSENGKSSTVVPDRSTIFCDQGPQAFFIDEFMELYVTLTEEQIDSYIEAGRMYLEKGYEVGLIMGDRNNFKITTDFDLILAEAMIKEGRIK